MAAIHQGKSGKRRMKGEGRSVPVAESQLPQRLTINVNVAMATYEDGRVEPVCSQKSWNKRFTSRRRRDAW